jgi:uncharacterized repeat protein (TIGR02543 family)
MFTKFKTVFAATLLFLLFIIVACDDPSSEDSIDTSSHTSESSSYTSDTSSYTSETSISSSSESEVIAPWDIQYEIYELAVTTGYDNSFATWIEALKGLATDVVIMRIGPNDYLQWRYEIETDDDWRDLLSVTLLIGPLDEGLITAYERYLDEIDPLFIGDENDWLFDLMTGYLGENIIYTVSFDLDGGESLPIEQQEVRRGHKVDPVDDPTRTGYEFIGWYVGELIWDFDDFVLSDLALVAQWQAMTFTITFDYLDGPTLIEELIVTYDQFFELPEPEWEDYLFLGWEYDDDWFDDGVWTMLEDITLYAVWVRAYYTITFDYQGAPVVIETMDVPYGHTFALPVPIWDEHIFLGWLYEDNYIDDYEWILLDDVTLVAHWVKEFYTITYVDIDLDEDGFDDIQIVAYGTYFQLLDIFITGHEFEGWYHEDILITGGLWLFEEDLYLEGVWNPRVYQIYFNPGQGTVNKYYVEVTFNQMYQLPVAVSNTGIPFDGWYFQGQQWTDNLGQSLAPFTHDTIFSTVIVTAVYFHRIYDAQDLDDIRLDLSSVYRLMNDVDISHLNWVPIGTEKNPFIGSLDGNGYSIIGLTIDQPYQYTGLFGYVRGPGKITDLTLENVDIEIAENDIKFYVYVGGLIGYTDGLVVIANITTLSGTITSSNEYSNYYVGGIIGYHYRTPPVTFNSLFNHLTIINASKNITEATGGILGYSYWGVIINDSVNYGDITSGRSYTGGIIGRAGSLLRINNSFNEGNISGSNNVGGIAGSISAELISNSSYNTGNIQGSGSAIGGLFGQTDRATITESYNTGMVKGTIYVGGLIGQIFTASGSLLTIQQSYNTGLIEGLSIYASSLGVGGFVGYTHTANITINNSYNQGDILAPLMSGVGGFVGAINPSGQLEIILLNVYTTGVINGVNHLGAFVGYCKGDVTITNSVSFATIIASDSSNMDTVNYLVGSVTDILTIDNSYYSGLIYIDEVEQVKESQGIFIDDISDIDEEFFITTLGWNVNVWDFSDLDVTIDEYPNLMIN